MNGETMTHCPAKINLGLSIFHRRKPDGYHYLASIFVPISFGDEISFTRASSDKLVSENLLTGKPAQDFESVSERGDLKKNLLWRGLQAFADRRDEGVRIHVRKRIPPGAGLGGGSSNVGSLLRYLGSEFGIGNSELQEAAVRLGADVPFFLEDGARLALGIGEILWPIPLGRGYGTLAMPELTVSTRSAYEDLKRPLQETPSPETWTVLDENARTALKNSEWGKLKRLVNDFEESVFVRHPLLARIKDAMHRNGAAFASLTGTGSAVYALTDSKSVQIELTAQLEEEFPEVRFAAFEF